jgi:hypothetical protein
MPSSERLIENPARLIEREEQIHVQAFIPQLAIKELYMSVVHRHTYGRLFCFTPWDDPTDID